MKRPEHIIEDLITRQLDGTPLTDTERRELQEWLEASEANRDAFLRAYKAWGNARLAETRFNTGQALENVMARIAEASRPRSFLRPQLRRLGIGIAAAACVMLAVVGYYRLQPSTVPDIEMFIRQADTPVFTQKEVQLVLSEQKTLLLETQKSTIRYDSTAIRINNAEKTIPKKEAATFNQLVVPYGKQTTLTLADGTRVWINAGSRLVYPVVFEKQKREIYVEGEIYMEVAHDAERPFSVHTGKMDVCVLGTKFYISSYGRDRTQEVVLLSGSVSVAPAGRSDRGIRIVPGQQAILGTSESLEVREVEAEIHQLDSRIPALRQRPAVEHPRTPFPLLQLSDRVYARSRSADALGQTRTQRRSGRSAENLERNSPYQPANHRIREFPNRL